MSRAIITFLVCLTLGASAAHANQGEERDKVRIAALRFLMTKHAEFGNERQHYAYYVLRDVTYVKYFADFQPPVVAFNEARYPTSSGQAVDAVTGRPVKIWSIGGEKLERDSASVGISWYSGRKAGGLHVIFLKKKDGVWIAESERTDALSLKRADPEHYSTTHFARG